MNATVCTKTGFFPILAGGILSSLCLAVTPAGATLVNSASTPALAVPAQLFTTSENGAVNPSFSLSGVPGYGSLTISYGPFFNGQSASNPLLPPITVSGTPSGVLALSGSTSVVKTTVEVDNNEPVPNTEVLGGLPSLATNGFGGPIAILFSVPVSGVTLTAGFFDTTGTTSITAYGGDGTSLGSIANLSTGYETFNLSDSGGPPISGLLLTSSDPGGFGIDGVGIVARQIATPAPGPLAVLPGFALIALSRLWAASGRLRLR